MPLLLLLLLTPNAVGLSSTLLQHTRPALLRLRGGGSPQIVHTAAAQDIQPRPKAPPQQTQPRPEAPPPQTIHDPPPRWPDGSGLVIALLYLVALVNGLARRTLSCAAPVLERDGLYTKADLDGMYMGGYQRFALGRALAAPIISRLGSKHALLLQLAALTLSTTGFCASASRPSVQAACWAPVRVGPALAPALTLALTVALPLPDQAVPAPTTSPNHQP